MEHDDSRAEHEQERDADEPRDTGPEPLLPRCKVNLGAAQGKDQHHRHEQEDHPSHLPDRIA